MSLPRWGQSAGRDLIEKAQEDAPIVHLSPADQNSDQACAQPMTRATANDGG